jgi:dTDP-4-amino-4,6-dideoxygalactose transaminase
MTNIKEQKMQVPFLDLKIQYKSIKSEVDPAIQNILDNTAFILGKAVSDFESEFAREHNVKHCLGVSSGTDGNHLALWALGIQPGDEVIMPANTFIATAWGATLCGAKPIFVDCEKDSYNIDPNKVVAAITKKTKAIAAVHLYGQPADLDPLKEIAKKYNLFLVEDCAQSHFAEYKGKRIGGLSDSASFSFYPGKNLGAYGEGGAVTTHDDEVAKRVKMLRDHGAVQKYNHEMLGHNYRMEGIQGAVLGVKLKHLKKWTDGRRRAAQKYNELLKDCSSITLPKEMSYAKHVYHLFVIQVNKGGNTRRDELAKFLGDNGVSTGLHYPIPLHQQPCFKDLGYKKGDFPVTENLAETGLSLPMYPELSDEQIKYVSDKIKLFFR